MVNRSFLYLLRRKFLGLTAMVSPRFLLSLLPSSSQQSPFSSPQSAL